MDRAPEPPPIGISDAEVAEILGVRELSVSRLVGRGVPHKPAKGRNRALDRAEAERIALERYRPSHPYWLTTREAADFLGVTGSGSGSSPRPIGCRASFTTDAATTAGARSR